MQLPGELLRSLQGAAGFNEASFKAVHASGEQVTSIRINPAKIQPGDLDILRGELQPVPWCPHGFYLNERPSFTLDPMLHAGAYYVQEASSMFLWHVLGSVVDRAQHKVVLDLCAAPGGKSTLLSSFFTGGIVVANEVIRQRVNILEENITKWGDANTIVTSNDSKDFDKLNGFFDVIVTDAPCSGSGLFRKDPDAITEWSPGNVQLCAQRQQRIAADIIPCLKDNGIFIYSTCSYSKEEDEDILDWIVAEFGLQSLEIQTPAKWNIVESASPQQGAKGYRFYPDHLKGEGFFIAAFRQVNPVREARRKEASISLATAKEKALLAENVNLAPGIEVFRHKETFNLFPGDYFAALKVIAGHLYVKQAGIAAGSFKGKSFVPEHALAVSTAGTLFPGIDVTKEEALSYLRKQDIKPAAPQGWCRVRYKGQGLGWIKNLPNRANNYYPSEWRILKS